MDEIIVVRVTDPDGSLFQAIMDALKDKRTEIIHVTAPFSTVLRIGELGGDMNYLRPPVLQRIHDCLK